MLALVVLGLVACESASSFSFHKVTENWDEVIYHRNNYDSQLVILNKKKRNLNVLKEYLDERVKNIEMQKDNLDTEINKLNVQTDDLDRKIDKLNMQKAVIDRETDIVYRKKDNFDRNIDDLYKQKDQLDDEIDKVDLEIENHYIYIDRDLYKIDRVVVKEEVVKDNEYSININLPGFNKNEIVVKSGKGRLVIQALHDVLGEPKRSFKNIVSLPDYLTEHGSWSYKWDVLRIVFPIIECTTHETTNANPDYDITDTTPVNSQGNDIYANADSKNEVVKVEATSQETSQGNDIYANADSKNEVVKVEATSQETSQGNDIYANADSKNEVVKVEATSQETSQGDR